MLSDDKIEEIVSKAHWKFTGIKNTFSNVVEEAIKEALALAEKSRWKYPDKGELPEILSKHIIFYLNGSIARPRIGMAYKDKDGIFMFFCNDTKQGYPKTQVKAWTYAPVMEEG